MGKYVIKTTKTGFTFNLKAGNNEFREAAAQTRKALEAYELPEVRYFLETFLDSFSLTLDELK